KLIWRVKRSGIACIVYTARERRGPFPVRAPAPALLRLSARNDNMTAPATPARRDFLKMSGTALAASCLPRLATATTVPAEAAPVTMESWTSESPFLSRAFAPVFDERDDAN